LWIVDVLLKKSLTDMETQRFYPIFFHKVYSFMFKFLIHFLYIVWGMDGHYLFLPHI
jgi:hypothetical protein